MFCSSCGVALSQHLKYCNHCGAQLATNMEAVVKKAEKRLDEYLEGLFWVTFLGLGLIVGGIAAMQALHVNAGVMIAFMVLSSGAFLVNFWLNLREILRISRSSKEPKGADRLEPLSTKELGPGNAQAVIDATPSITEHTTRELELISKEDIRL